MFWGKLKPDQIPLFTFFPLLLSFMYGLGSPSAMKRMPLQKDEST